MSNTSGAGLFADAGPMAATGQGPAAKPRVNSGLVCINNPVLAIGISTAALGPAWLVQELPQASGPSESLDSVLSTASRRNSSEDASRNVSPRPARQVGPTHPTPAPGAHFSSSTLPYYPDVQYDPSPPQLLEWTAAATPLLVCNEDIQKCLTDAVPSGVRPSPWRGRPSLAAAVQVSMSRRAIVCCIIGLLLAGGLPLTSRTHWRSLHCDAARQSA